MNRILTEVQAYKLKPENWNKRAEARARKQRYEVRVIELQSSGAIELYEGVGED